jgi:carbon monoxide dehydrogenase subunit G
VELNGVREFDVPRVAVWRAIADPAKMASLMPGVSNLAVIDDRHWHATVKIPIGLGGLKMKMKFERVAERPLEYALLSAKGNGVGAIVNMTTSFTLSGEGERTSLCWKADVRIGGPVGSMGQRVLQPQITRQIEGVLNALETHVLEDSAQGPVSGLVA